MQISRARDMQGKIRGERGRGRASSRPLSTRADHLRVQTESYDEITTGDSPLNASLRSSTIPAPATVRGVRGRGRASERSLSTRAYRGRASSRPLSTRANHLRVQTELYDETTTGDSLLNASLHSSAIPAPATAVPPFPHPQPASNRADNDALQQALNLRAAAREMNNPQRDFLDGFASTIIFEENNKLVKSDEIDLHGLFVREAQLKVDEAISQRERRGDRRVLFIVGQGKNSDGGVPKLKPNLTEYIEKMPREVKEHPDNPGKLVVTLLGNQSSMPLPVPILVG
ncbi:hypothetical protein B0H11DRAFT_196046 [Mycena galericulata]|nr:hypothetical protein B0H11DRAFT_196046 [Mycena galericulata]